MSERDTKTALITGVLGQDGSYLAELLTTKGYRVIGTSHRGEQRTRLGGAAKEIEVLGLDLADGEAIRALVKRTRPHHLYNLAARASSAQLFDDVVATTRINRQDFGVKWNATLDNGGVVVGDDVNITIDAEMTKQVAK